MEHGLLSANNSNYSQGSTSRLSTFRLFQKSSTNVTTREADRPPTPPAKDSNYPRYNQSTPSLLLSTGAAGSSRAEYLGPPTPAPSIRLNGTGTAGRSAGGGKKLFTRLAGSIGRMRTVHSPTLNENGGPRSASGGSSEGDRSIPSPGIGEHISIPRTAADTNGLTGAHEPDASISKPWNFQHHVHVDEQFTGLPPSWASALAERGYSPEEIEAMQRQREQGRRGRGLYAPISPSPDSDPPSVNDWRPQPRSDSLPSNASVINSPITTNVATSPATTTTALANSLVWPSSPTTTSHHSTSSPSQHSHSQSQSQSQSRASTRNHAPTPLRVVNDDDVLNDIQEVEQPAAAGELDILSPPPAYRARSISSGAQSTAVAALQQERWRNEKREPLPAMPSSSLGVNTRSPLPRIPNIERSDSFLPSTTPTPPPPLTPSEPSPNPLPASATVESRTLPQKAEYQPQPQPAPAQLNTKTEQPPPFQLTPPPTAQGGAPLPHPLTSSQGVDIPPPTPSKDPSPPALLGRKEPPVSASPQKELPSPVSAVKRVPVHYSSFFSQPPPLPMPPPRTPAVLTSTPGAGPSGSGKVSHVKTGSAGSISHPYSATYEEDMEPSPVEEVDEPASEVVTEEDDDIDATPMKMKYKKSLNFKLPDISLGLGLGSDGESTGDGAEGDWSKTVLDVLGGVGISPEKENRRSRLFWNSKASASVRGPASLPPSSSAIDHQSQPEAESKSRTRQKELELRLNGIEHNMDDELGSSTKTSTTYSEDPSPLWREIMRLVNPPSPTVTSPPLPLLPSPSVSSPPLPPLPTAPAISASESPLPEATQSKSSASGSRAPSPTPSTGKNRDSLHPMVDPRQRRLSALKSPPPFPPPMYPPPSPSLLSPLPLSPLPSSQPSSSPRSRSPSLSPGPLEVLPLSPRLKTTFSSGPNTTVDSDRKPAMVNGPLPPLPAPPPEEKEKEADVLSDVDPADVSRDSIMSGYSTMNMNSVHIAMAEVVKMGLGRATMRNPAPPLPSPRPGAGFGAAARGPSPSGMPLPLSPTSGGSSPGLERDDPSPLLDYMLNSDDEDVYDGLEETEPQASPEFDEKRNAVSHELQVNKSSPTVLDQWLEHDDETRRLEVIVEPNANQHRKDSQEVPEPELSYPLSAITAYTSYTDSPVDPGVSLTRPGSSLPPHSAQTSSSLLSPAIIPAQIQQSEERRGKQSLRQMLATTGVPDTLKPLASFIHANVDPPTLFADMHPVAEGTYGSVYSARYVYEGDNSDTTVAIKCVPLTKEKKLEMLAKEMEVMGMLRNEHILSLEDMYLDLDDKDEDRGGDGERDMLWIQMELMERSLADILGLYEVLRLPETVVARFAKDALSAVAFLREHGIAHRDVRSDNMLVNPQGILKLADFTHVIAVTEPESTSSEVVGVSFWQAPEIRSGSYDPLKVDIWGVGATIWESIEGSPPFADLDIEDDRLLPDRWPELTQAELYSRGLHDFLRLCSEPAVSRPTASQLLTSAFVKSAGTHADVVQLLARCREIEEQEE